MTDLPEPTFTQLSILEGHRLLTLAVYELGEDDAQSALYEHALDAADDEAAEPLLDANTWLTAALPRTDSPLVFGSVDGEVVFAGDEDVEAVEASGASITGLCERDDVIVASTAQGEVLALADGEVTVWKSEGPALLTAAVLDGAVWVAGDEGYLARRDGEKWVQVATNTTQPLVALAHTGGAVIAVGGAGTIVHVEGERATVRTEGGEQLHGVAVWGSKVVIAAGAGGLRQLTADGTIVLRSDACEAVAADSKYLVIASGGALLSTEDGVTWKPLAYADPDPADDHDHDHDNCDHEH